jgi:integrase
MTDQLARVKVTERELGRVIPWVFPHLRGRFKGQRRTTVNYAWDRACQRAGLTGRLLHDLRRSAVRNMVNAGIAQRVAMQITGHRTHTVFTRYHIVTPGDLQDATCKLVVSDKSIDNGHIPQAQSSVERGEVLEFLGG